MPTNRCKSSVPEKPGEEDCTIRRPIVANYKITKEITMRALCVRSPHRRPEVQRNSHLQYVYSFPQVSVGLVHGLSRSDGHFQRRSEAGYGSRRWDRYFDGFARAGTSSTLRDISKEKLIVALNGPL
jgi:hypothetical protein